MSAKRYTDKDGDVWETFPGGFLVHVEDRNGDPVDQEFAARRSSLAALVIDYGPISAAPPKTDPADAIRAAALDTLYHVFPDSVGYTMPRGVPATDYVEIERDDGGQYRVTVTVDEVARRD